MFSVSFVILVFCKLLRENCRLNEKKCKCWKRQSRSARLDVETPIQTDVHLNSLIMRTSTHEFNDPSGWTHQIATLPQICPLLFSHKKNPKKNIIKGVRSFKGKEVEGAGKIGAVWPRTGSFSPIRPGQSSTPTLMLGFIFPLCLAICFQCLFL
jgi:hypothetical protein